MPGLRHGSDEGQDLALLPVTLANLVIAIVPHLMV